MFTVRDYSQRIRSSLVFVYLPIALCFFVINITNHRILGVLQSRGVMYVATADAAANAEKTARFFLVPAKSLIFFVCSTMLIVPLGLRLVRHLREVLKSKDVFATLGSMCLCVTLIATIFPISFGRSYARLSTDPFAQDISQVYRRLLLPGLANLFHFDGFLYIFFFWALVFLTAIVVRLYFQSKGITLSVLHETSLLTVGVFAGCFQVPGYPEIAVLLLALIALIEFDADGAFTSKQVAAFALAIMAHESCAVLVFAPLFLFLFGRRSWLSGIAVLALYMGMMLINFSFNLSVPLHLQSMVSETPARDFFVQSPSTVFIAAGFAFKATWIVIAAGIIYLFQTNKRLALLVVSGVALACASTYIAIDYTRLIGFATIPMLLCFQQVQKRFPPKLLNAVMILNLLIPSFYVGGNTGIVACKGLYYLAYGTLFKLSRPTF